MAKVILKKVGKTYGSKVIAVKDFNLEVKDKEFVVLVGPSGCGKSTTLRMIAGLEDITEGEIHIDNLLVNDLPAKDRDIAMVFQNYALYPHMSIYDNLSFGLRLRKLPAPEIKQRVKDAAQMLGIYDLLHRIPKELSGGQQQRAAVGRAIVRKPKVFLFDEPLSNLDAKMRVQMRLEIIKLHQRLQATMIYVTHDQVEAMTMGERIVVMKDGLVHQIAAPLDLYEFPVNKFVAGFIGSPPMNFFEGKIVKEEVRFFFKTEVFKILLAPEITEKVSPYREKKIYLGIRPEHISIGENGQISVQVEVVEPLGNETLLHLRCGENLLLCRRFVSGEIRKIQEEIKISFDPKQIQLFDLDTENSILH
ncbi:glycerol-3-phosphate ABC transporter ATP-binding protein [bacterium Unc6]|nr:glycerol-3-phosphate ABC transporter ATP-binding protein [bacterium Unc6]